MDIIMVNNIIEATKNTHIIVLNSKEYKGQNVFKYAYEICAHR